MPRSLYKTSPSEHLLQKAVQSIGLQNMHDTKWIDETALNPELMIEVIEELRLIMYPCMVKQFLDRQEHDYKSYFTLVRQLIKHKGRNFNRREKCVQIQKNVYHYLTTYQLKPSLEARPVEIAFD